MARPKASQTVSCVPVVAEPTNSGHRKKAGTTPPEVICFDNVIVLDSEEELEAATLKPSTSKFGSSRVVDHAAFSNLEHKPMLTPSKSSERKMKDSRKRVLAVEDPSGASMFESKCFQASPSSTKNITLGEGNFPFSETRTTAEPAVDPGAFEQAVKVKCKHKSGVKVEMQSATTERVELDNKENNGSDVQGGNGVYSPNGAKKRKTETDSPVVSESSAQRAPSPSGGPVPIEGKLFTTCHQCRQRLSTSAAWCRNTSGKRQCTQRYCAKCLLNRYGEVVAEVEDLQSWRCPRCRGICNCSLCM